MRTSTSLRTQAFRSLLRRATNVVRSAKATELDHVFSIATSLTALSAITCSQCKDIRTTCLELIPASLTLLSANPPVSGNALQENLTCHICLAATTEASNQIVNFLMSRLRSASYLETEKLLQHREFIKTMMLSATLSFAETPKDAALKAESLKLLNKVAQHLKIHESAAASSEPPVSQTSDQIAKGSLPSLAYSYCSISGARITRRLVDMIPAGRFKAEFLTPVSIDDLCGGAWALAFCGKLSPREFKILDGVIQRRVESVLGEFMVEAQNQTVLSSDSKKIETGPLSRPFEHPIFDRFAEHAELIEPKKSEKTAPVREEKNETGVIADELSTQLLEKIGGSCVVLLQRAMLFFEASLLFAASVNSSLLDPKISFALFARKDAMHALSLLVECAATPPQLASLMGLINDPKYILPEVSRSRLMLAIECRLSQIMKLERTPSIRNNLLSRNQYILRFRNRALQNVMFRELSRMARDRPLQQSTLDSIGVWLESRKKVELHTISTLGKSYKAASLWMILACIGSSGFDISDFALSVWQDKTKKGTVAAPYVVELLEMDRTFQYVLTNVWVIKPNFNLAFGMVQVAIDFWERGFRENPQTAKSIRAPTLLMCYEIISQKRDVELLRRLERVFLASWKARTAPPSSAVLARLFVETSRFPTHEKFHAALSSQMLPKLANVVRAAESKKELHDQCFIILNCVRNYVPEEAMKSIDEAYSKRDAFFQKDPNS